MADMTVDQLANPETNLGLPDFCDRRVFAVPHTYTHRHEPQWVNADGFEVGQSHDGTTARTTSWLAPTSPTNAWRATCACWASATA